MAPALLVQDRSDDYNSSKVTSVKPKAYLIDKYHPEAIKHAQNLFDLVLPTDPEIHQWRENAEHLLVRSSSVSADDIRAAKKLRAIGKQGVGFDKIDAEACKEQGIEILNTPGINANAVAEIVLSLALVVARQIGPIQVKMAKGESVPKETCSGLVLTGKTLGLIGMGNIGKAVARMFRGAFSANVIAYDPFLPQDAWNDMPHSRAETVSEVIRSADVLSIHVPLTTTTRDLISYRELQTMKPESILINAARGGIVNEKDLTRALQEGLIWGAGLDCHEQEPPTLAEYEALWSTGRVVSTPHIGAATAQTQMETAKAAVDRLYDFATKPL